MSDNQKPDAGAGPGDANSDDIQSRRKPLKLSDTAEKHAHEEAEESGSEWSTSQSHSSRGCPPALLINVPLVSMVEETGEASSQILKPTTFLKQPYDPQLHINTEPPISMATIVFTAILESQPRALSVEEIYTWISDRFPFYKKSPINWKFQVVRSLEEERCFKRTGEESVWTIDPRYPPNLYLVLKVPHEPQD